MLKNSNDLTYGYSDDEEQDAAMYEDGAEHTGSIITTLRNIPRTVFNQPLVYDRLKPKHFMYPEESMVLETCPPTTRLLDFTLSSGCPSYCKPLLQQTISCNIAELCKKPISLYNIMTCNECTGLFNKRSNAVALHYRFGPEDKNDAFYLDSSHVLNAKIRIYKEVQGADRCGNCVTKMCTKLRSNGIIELKRCIGDCVTYRLSHCGVEYHINFRKVTKVAYDECGRKICRPCLQAVSITIVTSKCY